MDPLTTLPHKTKYRGQWQHTSNHLRPQGVYEWMAEQLGELAPRKILDIGCGSGNGLLALMSRFNPQTLISLEENLDCIETTLDALVEAGHHPLAHPRLSYQPVAGNKYDLRCSPGPVELDPGISIVQTDVGCNDPPLNHALMQGGPFDAITVWLVGTDGHYLHTISSNATDYRWQIQRRICDLAEGLLRPGGWIQFVDRAVYPLTDEQEMEQVRKHEELLEPSRLKLRSFASRPYEEAGEGGIPMATASGKIGNQFKMGLNSIISWLPDETAER